MAEWPYTEPLGWLPCTSEPPRTGAIGTLQTSISVPQARDHGRVNGRHITCPPAHLQGCVTACEPGGIVGTLPLLPTTSFEIPSPSCCCHHFMLSCLSVHTCEASPAAPPASEVSADVQSNNSNSSMYCFICCDPVFSAHYSWVGNSWGKYLIHRSSFRSWVSSHHTCFSTISRMPVGQTSLLHLKYAQLG